MDFEYFGYLMDFEYFGYISDLHKRKGSLGPLARLRYLNRKVKLKVKLIL
jgi:hypothetical protein